MNIKVLGTAGVESVFRSPAYLIDGTILIDIPNGCWKEIKGLSFKDLSCDCLSINDILITHFHADHFFDVPFVFLTREGKTDQVLTFYCGTSGKQTIPDIVRIGYPDLFERVMTNVKYAVNDAEKFRIGAYDIERVPVKHGSLDDCFGYIFDDGKTRTGFTGDTMFCEAVENMAARCNTLICECAGLDSSPNHIGVGDIEKLSALYPDCRILTTHMSDSSRELLEHKHLPNVTVLSDLDELES